MYLGTAYGKWICIGVFVMPVAFILGCLCGVFLVVVVERYSKYVMGRKTEANQDRVINSQKDEKIYENHHLDAIIDEWPFIGLSDNKLELTDEMKGVVKTLFDRYESGSQKNYLISSHHYAKYLRPDNGVDYEEVTHGDGH